MCTNWIDSSYELSADYTKREAGTLRRKIIIKTLSVGLTVNSQF